MIVKISNFIRKIYNIDSLDYTDILFLNCIKMQKYIEKIQIFGTDKIVLFKVTLF